jgi:hypothetical protein
VGAHRGDGRARYGTDDVVVVDDEGVVVVEVVDGGDVVEVVVVGGAPEETTMLTELPGATGVPAFGLEEMTTPAVGYWVDVWLVTLPTLRPACWRSE